MSAKTYLDILKGFLIIEHKDDEKLLSVLDNIKKCEIHTEDDIKALHLIFSKHSDWLYFTTSYLTKALSIIQNKIDKEMLLITNVNPNLSDEEDLDEYILNKDLKKNKEEELKILSEEKNNKKSFELRVQSANLRLENSFSTFVTGDNTQFAANVCLTIINNEEDRLNGLTTSLDYNPLLIFGDPGLGKTHLAQALAIDLLKLNPNIKALYTTTEEFTNEFIQSLKNNFNQDNTSKFRSKYREPDVIIIDDIQFLEKIVGRGEGKVEEEFFHTFNDLIAHSKRIILVSDRSAKQLTFLTDRITSRIKSGVDVEIQKPNVETKIAILRSYAEKDNFELSEEHQIYIAQNIDTNIRELQGVYNKIKLFQKVMNIKPTLNDVKNIIETTASEKVKKLTSDIVLNEIATFYDLDKDILTNGRRSTEYSKEIKMTMYILREVLGINYTNIALIMGKRSHSTISKSNDQFKEKLESDEALKTEYKQIIHRITHKKE